MGTEVVSKQLVVATLNYSGILLSPFQFYSEQMYKQEQELSNNFFNVVRESQKKFDSKSFKWGLGKIDKKMQQERYTPIYRPDAGIFQGKLVTEELFQKLWKEIFFTSVKKIELEYTEEEMKNAMAFDLTCYKTIIRTVYKEKDLSKAPKLNIQEYKRFMKPFFQKIFLDENRKIQKLFKALEKRRVDVAFLQQINEQFVRLIPNKYFFFSDQEKDCGILILRSSFQKVHDSKTILGKYHPQFVERLTWNNNRCLCFVDDFIFISSHLSSKAEKNKQQQLDMLEAVAELRVMNPTLKIVVGMDCNSFLQVSNKLKADNFWSYPESSDVVTTRKKRTWMQPQVNKADEEIAACRDHLLSSERLVNARVVSIDDEPAHTLKYIPTENHPHDHFVVTASLQLRQIRR